MGPVPGWVNRFASNADATVTAVTYARDQMRVVGEEIGLAATAATNWLISGGEGERGKGRGRGGHFDRLTVRLRLLFFYSRLGVNSTTPPTETCHWLKHTTHDAHTADARARACVFARTVFARTGITRDDTNACLLPMKHELLSSKSWCEKSGSHTGVCGVT